MTFWKPRVYTRQLCTVSEELQSFVPRLQPISMRASCCDTGLFGFGGSSGTHPPFLVTPHYKQIALRKLIVIGLPGSAGKQQTFHTRYQNF